MSHRKPRRQKAYPSFSSGNRQATELVSPMEQKIFLDFYNADDYGKAQDYASELAQCYPRDPFAWKVWGSCLQAIGKTEKARDALKRAYQLDADDAQTCHLLARTQKDLGNADSALDYARKAVFLEPDYAQGRFTLAQLLAESSYGSEAFEHVDQAEALGYNRTACLVLRGHLQEKGRRFAELRSTIDTLLQLDPKNPHTYNDLANYHKDLGQFEQAEQAYIKALELDPQLHAAALNRIICAHYNPAYSAEDILDTIQQLQTYLTVDNIEPRQISNNKQPNKTIKIGLVSPGLRLHPVGQMITTALEQLSPGFEIYAYSANAPADIITHRIRSVATKWQTVGHLDEDKLADQIQFDGIDILIDLAGYGDGSRLKTMAQKPAPLIVKWVGGLINTMGMSAFDYLISDNIETPEGVDKMYTEKLIRMPNDYICYLPPEYAPAITALPALKNRFITLGCFNNSAKINTIILEQWALIMQELPNSQLLLKSGQYENEGYCQHIHDIMAAHGITSDRILLEGQSKHQELLETYNRVDIALDTWPYSGGVTTCEAFMMGVPVVTLPGPTFAGRHSATHLINAGMPELVVNSWEEYRQRVTELASDIPNLSVIRACLRQFLIQSPVCDAEQFGKHFSTAMRAIWQRYCEGKSAAALTLDKQGNPFFADSTTAVEIDQPPFQKKIKADFSWALQGKIVAIDNGARLLGNPVIEALLDKEALELVAFDPASRETKNPGLGKAGIHYYPNSSLGDGQSTTLKATLDPAMSSLLEPLVVSTETDGRRVLARLPFNTVALDNIDGLPNLDWLVIDELSDSATILEYGQQALKSSLLIQIDVAFQATHERQPNLDEVQRWASHNGFRFYRLHDLKHRSLMPAGLNNSGQPSSELLSAQALLLPDHERMAALDHRQATKLSFLLHTVYGLQDAACSLLASPAEQQQYLNTVEKEAGSTLMSADTQWQPMVQAMMLTNRPIKPRSHGLPSDLIVSLTSYPGRFSTLWATLQSLLTQTVTPDRVVLWIAQDDREKLPESVLSLVATGLEIHYCEDIRSYKKIVPTLRRWPDAYIATADDDVYYWPTWLEELVNATQPNKKEIAAHRVHKIRLNQKSEVLPYKEWEWNSTRSLEADVLNFPTGVAGVLYPPNCFHEDVMDVSIFSDICFTGDDIWLYVMARLRGYSFKHTGRQGFMVWPGSQKESLFKHNIFQNDQNMNNMIKKYGFPDEVEKNHESQKKTIEQKLISFLEKDIYHIKPAGTHGIYLEGNASIQSIVLPSKLFKTCFIGHNSYLNPESYIRHGVFVGRYTSIGRRVSLGAAHHDTDFLTTSPRIFSNTSSDQETPTIIGNDVWIGDNVVVLSGVTIGDGAIIAAGAIVNKDVPPYSVYGGIPAKKIKSRFDQNVANKLLSSRWWNKNEEEIVKFTKKLGHDNIALAKKLSTLSDITSIETNFK